MLINLPENNAQLPSLLRTFWALCSHRASGFCTFLPCQVVNHKDTLTVGSSALQSTHHPAPSSACMNTHIGFFFFLMMMMKSFLSLEKGLEWDCRGLCATPTRLSCSESHQHCKQVLGQTQAQIKRGKKA